MIMFLALRRHAITKHQCDQVRGTELGQVSVMMAILAPILIFGFVGLLWDGGQGVNQRAETEDVAFGAARVAATQTVVGPTGVSLDAAAAVGAANAYVARYPTITATITVSGGTVTVTTNSVYEPDFLGVLGVSPWTFTATHSAETQVGVTANNDI